MDHETVCAYCESLPGVEATAPFGPDTVVHKVLGKMFTVVSLNEARINLKCDPVQAIELREQYDAVEPGYHMNKKHWNSVLWKREALANELMHAWIDDSYNLVVASMTKKLKAELAALAPE